MGEARVAIATAGRVVVKGKGSEREYPLSMPRPGWAEQDPEDWWRALGVSVRKAVAEAGVRPTEIAAIAIDATCCSVVALDAAGRPLRPALIWMDVRAARQAEKVRILFATRTKELPPRDFVEMMRSAIKEDEWMLYAHGAIMGLGGGFLHLWIFGVQGG
jgi:sugar (pentulose or hexulose) kinase